MAFVNFLVLPGMFYAAFSGDQTNTHKAFAVIMLKTVVGLLVQTLIGRKVAAWYGVDDHLTKQWLHASIASPVWVFYMMIAIIELADSDLDGLNAGSAWRLPPHIQDRFRAAWIHVPMVGQIAVALGINGILTLIIVFASLVQAIELGSLLWTLYNDILPALEVYDERSISATSHWARVYLQVQHVCDAASVTLLAEVFNRLAQHECKLNITNCRVKDKPVGYVFAGRSVAFRVKVLCEALPTLWFSISFLQRTIGHIEHYVLLVAVMSVVTSFVCIAKASWSELMGGLEAVRAGWILKGGGGNSRKIVWGAVYRLTVLVLTQELLVANIVRFVGLWVCDSHTLNLSAGGCINLDSH